MEKNIERVLKVIEATEQTASLERSILNIKMNKELDLIKRELGYRTLYPDWEEGGELDRIRKIGKEIVNLRKRVGALKHHIDVDISTERFKRRNEGK